jgi:hypothetical protein
MNMEILHLVFTVLTVVGLWLAWRDLVNLHEAIAHEREQVEQLQADMELLLLKLVVSRKAEETNP